MMVHCMGVCVNSPPRPPPPPGDLLATVDIIAHAEPSDTAMVPTPTPGQGFKEASDMTHSMPFTRGQSLLPIAARENGYVAALCDAMYVYVVPLCSYIGQQRHGCHRPLHLADYVWRHGL